VVSDLWAECRRIVHGTVAAVLVVGFTVGLMTAAYPLVASSRRLGQAGESSTASGEGGSWRR
jgi:hypothetical protein